MSCFVVTGGAGFIGSNLVHALVGRGHTVRVVDDFSTGRRSNIEGVMDRIELFEGSICDADVLRQALQGAEFCLHHAALASVALSLEDPAESNRINVDGTLRVFLAARDLGVRRVVYASSSAVYGNNEVLPASEDLPVAPVSPYGVTKAANELYGRVFTDLYGMDLVGFRYFNVFGPRQDPASQYAAVIPAFIDRVLEGKPPIIHGDGGQSRDFTHVDNVVAANLAACAVPEPVAGVYNIACGSGCTILELARMICELLGASINRSSPRRARGISAIPAPISPAPCERSDMRPR